MPAAIEFKRRLRWADADAAGRLHFVRPERRAKHVHREEVERHRRAEWVPGCYHLVPISKKLADGIKDLPVEEVHRIDGE